MVIHNRFFFQFQYFQLIVGSNTECRLIIGDENHVILETVCLQLFATTNRFFLRRKLTLVPEPEVDRLISEHRLFIISAYRLQQNIFVFPLEYASVSVGGTSFLAVTDVHCWVATARQKNNLTSVPIEARKCNSSPFEEFVTDGHEGP